jgi:hypothetical protein
VKSRKGVEEAVEVEEETVVVVSTTTHPQGMPMTNH